MTAGCAPTGMLADYAAGALSQGMSVIVASHLTFCPACRDKAARIEALCGALLAEGESVAPTSRCLREALARVGRPDPSEALPRASELPRPLCKRLRTPVCDLDWRQMTPGLEACWLDGFGADRVGLIRGEPGASVPSQGHSGLEATLVLAGEVRDGGRTLGRGWLELADASVEHAPQVVGSEPCLCLVVLPDGPRRTGPAAGAW